MLLVLRSVIDMLRAGACAVINYSYHAKNMIRGFKGKRHTSKKYHKKLRIDFSRHQRVVRFITEEPDSGFLAKNRTQNPEFSPDSGFWSQFCETQI